MKYSKYVYNYEIEECNQLMKRGIHPIGVGTNKTTGGVYHVFEPTRLYFQVLELIKKNTEL